MMFWGFAQIQEFDEHERHGSQRGGQREADKSEQYTQDYRDGKTEKAGPQRGAVAQRGGSVKIPAPEMRSTRNSS